MTQTILRPNFSQSKPNNYFASYEAAHKAAVLEKKELDWRECADFLRIYWNVADIAGIGGLLTKELRMNVLGSGEKIIRAYAYTNNLLWQQLKTLYVCQTAGCVQSILRLKMLDREMRIWSIDLYAVFERKNEKFLLSKCRIAGVRHIRHKSVTRQSEALAVLVLKDAKKVQINKTDGNKYSNEVIIEEQHKTLKEDGLLIISAKDDAALRENIADALKKERLTRVKFSCQGDFVVGIEE